ncbi:tryptophan synthase subunit alpha [Neobacillus notoginsengisoli]|uniref:tryptophan synthase subunit alpha n=1 Tax=Neobacillus notoginsengisoli TaxID=1578198 RepID=UPI001F0156B5|nr:tryptophan synthase subunit alpha [Neobacillus notoginsengisoli]
MRNQKQTFLAGYFVAGDPGVTESIQYMKAAVREGLDVIEVGIPSGNPFLEGEVISRAHGRIISDFETEQDTLDFLAALRKEVEVPIWIMGYSNDVVKSGLYKDIFAQNLADCFIIPDLPLQEALELKRELPGRLIPVINDGMADTEITQYVDGCPVVYCQIYRGKTGSVIPDFSSLPTFRARMRKITDAALMAGFGIKSARDVGQVLGAGFDGVVVGSQIVRLIEKNNQTSYNAFIRVLASMKETGKIRS